MKLFGDLRRDFGQLAVKAVRKLGEMEQKVARYRNHLVYNLRCRDEAVIPPSLRLKCPIPTKKAHDIVKKAQLDLVKERIRINSNKVSDLKEEIAVVKSDINNLALKIN